MSSKLRVQPSRRCSEKQLLNLRQPLPDGGKYYKDKVNQVKSKHSNEMFDENSLSVDDDSDPEWIENHVKCNNERENKGLLSETLSTTICSTSLKSTSTRGVDHRKNLEQLKNNMVFLKDTILIKLEELEIKSWDSEKLTSVWKVDNYQLLQKYERIIIESEATAEFKSTPYYANWKSDQSEPYVKLDAMPKYIGNRRETKIILVKRWPSQSEIETAKTNWEKWRINENRSSISKFDTDFTIKERDSAPTAASISVIDVDSSGSDSADEETETIESFEINDLPIESSDDEEMSDIKLNFRIFLKALILQSLNGSFLENINEKNDLYFTSALDFVDKECIRNFQQLTADGQMQISSALERTIIRNPSLLHQKLNNCWGYNAIIASCQTCSKAITSDCIVFEGIPYDRLSLKSCDDSLLFLSESIFTCWQCVQPIKRCHQLIHMKHYCYLECKKRVNEVQLKCTVRLNLQIGSKEISRALNNVMSDRLWVKSLSEKWLSLLQA